MAVFRFTIPDSLGENPFLEHDARRERWRELHVIVVRDLQLYISNVNDLGDVADPVSYYSWRLRYSEAKMPETYDFHEIEAIKHDPARWIVRYFNEIAKAFLWEFKSLDPPLSERLIGGLAEALGRTLGEGRGDVSTRVERWRRSFVGYADQSAGTQPKSISALPIQEFYDTRITDNPNCGKARQRVLETLCSMEPAILLSLAELCNNPELLAPAVTADAAAWHGPVDHLAWAHIRDAGRLEPSLGVIFGNLIPLRSAIGTWIADEPRHRWDFRDGHGMPLDWIAEAAVATLREWNLSRRLPQKLEWLNCDFYSYRHLGGQDAFRMFELEGRFNADSGFQEISLPNQTIAGMTPFVRQITIPRSPESSEARTPFTYRDRKRAKAEYMSLGKMAKDLKQIKSTAMQDHYFEWYVLYTFLGASLADIKRREVSKFPTFRKAVGDIDNVADLSNINKAVVKIATVVGHRKPSTARFRRSSAPR